MWVHVEHQRPPFFCPERPAKSDRVGFRHIATHDQDAIAIDQVLLKSCCTAAPKRCAQTGHRRRVSNARLIFDRNNTKPSVQQLLDQVILFNLERGAAQGRD